MRYLAVCTAALLPLLAGCGADISYKMGGGVDQLRADKQACGGLESPTYETCMKAKGWSTLDIKGKEAATEAEPAPVEVAARPESTPPAPTAAPTAATTPPAPVASAPVASAPKPKIDPRDMANVKAAPRPKASRDPNTRVTVNSWWKPGGSNAQAAITACVDTLGESHKPDYVKHTASQGLINCMSKSGWYAL